MLRRNVSHVVVGFGVAWFISGSRCLSWLGFGWFVVGLVRVCARKIANRVFRGGLRAHTNSASPRAEPRLTIYRASNLRIPPGFDHFSTKPCLTGPILKDLINP